MADAEHKEMTVREFVEQCVMKKHSTFPGFSFVDPHSPDADAMRTHSAMLLGYAAALKDSELHAMLSDTSNPACVEYITGPEMMRRASESLNEAANIIELLMRYSGLDL